MPHAYPPTMPPQGAQAQPYAPVGYALPQPSSSGNLDLSAIKPVQSGTVSIADAIAQAKAFASEKGISSYDLQRAPPAYGGDPRHFRSRSRSPSARRDAYRDNFNPYRDERRDDTRGSARDYGRDRSLSPGPSRGRPSGTFSPRGSSGRGGDDENEVMQIESSLVGLIIGRQGENLRRVESETGCRVQFITGPDNQGPYRQCRISGPRTKRPEARAAINRIIEDSGMGAIARAGLDKSHGAGGRNPPAATLREGEDCMQIMVPDRTVGLIIGRGGETIRDLQERSGCHINIVGENKSVNGLRPVNLIGTPEAAAQAKEAIMEIVDSDSRNVNGGGKQDRPPKNDFGRDSGPGGGGERINDSIYVPSEAVGMIIGKGGETIKEMQNTTGCKINVSQQNGPNEEREIGLVGSREAIDRAKRAIEDKVDAVVSALR
jgi:far upstream element-binding protein